MKIKILLATFILLLAVNAVAQKRYTLEKCKELAEKNNVALKNSQLSVEAAKQTEKEAFTNYFPNVSASAFTFKNSKPLVSVDLGATQLNMLKSGVTGGGTVIQPLYSGGKIHNGNRLSKLGIELSQDQHQLTKNEILIETEKDYWQIVSLTEKLKTINSIKISLDTLFRKVELSCRTGLALPNDVLKVKLKQNEIDATELKIKNGILLSKMTLCQYIGVPMDSADSIEVTVPDSTQIIPPVEYFVEHESVLLNRPEIRILDKNITASHLETLIKKSEYLPTVSIGANYGYDNFMQGKHFTGTVFATLSIPISDWWGGSHALQRQRIKETIAKNNYHEGKELLLLEMQQIQNEFTESFGQTQLSKLSVEESTENFRLNTDYYNAGTINLTDVLDAQSLLMQSRNNYTDACIQYFINKAKYLQVTAR